MQIQKKEQKSRQRIKTWISGKIPVHKSFAVKKIKGTMAQRYQNGDRSLHSLDENS